jgi:tetratricopeptide (TPR) repeat protein
LLWTLSTVPREFEDVVLTNLAGLLYKTGAIDEAITLMKDSLAINNKDPDSNFFMGNLYSAKGNYSGALFHYKQALHMKPDYPAAMQFVHVPACEMNLAPHSWKFFSDEYL